MLQDLDSPTSKGMERREVKSRSEMSLPEGRGEE